MQPLYYNLYLLICIYIYIYKITYMAKFVSPVPASIRFTSIGAKVFIKIKIINKL